MRYILDKVFGWGLPATGRAKGLTQSCMPPLLPPQARSLQAQLVCYILDKVFGGYPQAAIAKYTLQVGRGECWDGGWQARAEEEVGILTFSHMFHTPSLPPGGWPPIGCCRTSVSAGGSARFHA